MVEIFFPEQGDKIILHAIEEITFSHDVEEIHNLLEFQSF